MIDRHINFKGKLVLFPCTITSLETEVTTGLCLYNIILGDVAITYSIYPHMYYKCYTYLYRLCFYLHDISNNSKEGSNNWINLLAKGHIKELQKIHYFHIWNI